MILIIILSECAFGKDLFGSITPVGLSGFSQDVAKAIASVSKEPVTFREFPFERSIHSVLRGNSDFHFPILQPKDRSPQEVGIGFTQQTIGKVIFALYVNKRSQDVTPKSIREGKYVIEINEAHINFFSFPTTGSTCDECSLRKVNSGRIDGFLHAALMSDAIMARNPKMYENVESYYFDSFDIKFGVALTPSGEEVRHKLDWAISQLRRSGELQRLETETIQLNRAWKPTRIR